MSKAKVKQVTPAPVKIEVTKKVSITFKEFKNVFWEAIGTVCPIHLEDTEIDLMLKNMDVVKWYNKKGWHSGVKRCLIESCEYCIDEEIRDFLVEESAFEKEVQETYRKHVFPTIKTYEYTIKIKSNRRLKDVVECIEKRFDNTTVEVVR